MISYTFSTSLNAARRMLSDLMDEAAKYGLEVHESKTKIMWNGQGTSPDIKETQIRSRAFEILPPDGATMYLGRLFSFESTHDAVIFAIEAM